MNCFKQKSTDLLYCLDRMKCNCYYFLATDTRSKFHGMARRRKMNLVVDVRQYGSGITAHTSHIWGGHLPPTPPNFWLKCLMHCNGCNLVCYLVPDIQCKFFHTAGRHSYSLFACTTHLEHTPSRTFIGKVHIFPNLNTPCAISTGRIGYFDCTSGKILDQ